MTRSHTLDAYVATAEAWLDQVRENLELGTEERGRAMHALRAGLHAIRDRLPAAEVVDLGAQLPVIIRGIYYDGWQLGNDPTRIRDRAAMIERVQHELYPDRRLDAVEVLRAVIHVLIEHVSPGEILDVISTLPRPIAALWNDLSSHAIAAMAIDQDRPR